MISWINFQFYVYIAEARSNKSNSCISVIFDDRLCGHEGTLKEHVSNRTIKKNAERIDVMTLFFHSKTSTGICNGNEWWTNMEYHLGKLKETANEAVRRGQTSSILSLWTSKQSFRWTDLVHVTSYDISYTLRNLTFHLQLHHQRRFLHAWQASPIHEQLLVRGSPLMPPDTSILWTTFTSFKIGLC